MSGWFTELTAAPYQAGLISGWRGAVWVHGMAAIPWVVLIVGTALRFVEPELEEAALLDCSARQVLLRVTLRRVLPAIGVAAVWIAVGVGTEMTVTDIFQTPGVGLRTYAEEIYTDFALGTEAGQPHAAEIGVAVTAILAACALMLCLAAASWTPPTARPPVVFRLGRWRGLVSLGLLIAAAAIFGVPLVSLITKAGETVRHSAEGVFTRGWSVAECLKIIVMSPSRYRWEIGWSSLIAIVAACMVLAAALPIAWLARRRDALGHVGKFAAVLIAAAALAVPGPLVGIGLIAVFNHPGLAMLNFLYDRTIVVAAIAQAIRAFPLVMLIVWHALHTVPADQLEAAELDGAGVWTRLVRIVLPLRWPALAFAWLAAFVVAIGELSATILVVPPGVATLGVRISQLLHFNIQNELAGLCLILMAAAAILAGGLVFLAGRSGSAGRTPKPI
jgi:iron(III) transport system permease protein